MGRAGTPSPYLFQRVIQPSEPPLTSRSGKKTAGNKTKRKKEYLSTIPRVMMVTSLELEADFHLGRGSRFGRSIRFNSRIVFSQFFFISLVMEL